MRSRFGYGEAPESRLWAALYKAGAEETWPPMSDRKSEPAPRLGTKAADNNLKLNEAWSPTGKSRDLALQAWALGSAGVHVPSPVIAVNRLAPTRRSRGCPIRNPGPRTA